MRKTFVVVSLLDFMGDMSHNRWSMCLYVSLKYSFELIFDGFLCLFRNDEPDRKDEESSGVYVTVLPLS